MQPSHVEQSIYAWLGIFALAAVSPLFVNVALVDLVSITGYPMARAVLQSGLFTEHDSYIGAMRVLTALFLGVLVTFAFGLPLGVLVDRHTWARCLAFVVAVVAASAIWHLSQKWGIGGFVRQWDYPLWWVIMLATCGVAALVSKARSRH
jgi:hypothetical protein